MTNLIAQEPNLKPAKLYGLDHLRTLAITMVFLFHYGGMFGHPKWVRSISSFGWTGVDLFFVLSGYLISAQLFATIAKGQTISLKEFFLKRFFRIIPGYILIVAIYFCFAYVREREALAPLWKYLTFTQNLGLDLRTQGTFSHAWSLCIEEQFYFVLPLLLVVLVYFKIIKKAYWLLVFLFLFGFIIRWRVFDQLSGKYAADDFFGIYWYKWIYYPTYARLDGLLIGVSIAAVFQFRPRWSAAIKQRGNTLLLLSLIVLAATYFLSEDQTRFSATVFGFPMVAIGYGLMVMGAVSPSSFLYKKKSKITATIAMLSYALYLSHKIIIHVMQAEVSKLKISVDGELMLLICIIASIIGAIVMNRLIERPSQQVRARILAGNLKVKT